MRLAKIDAVKNAASRSTTQESQLPLPVQDEWGLFDPEQAGIAAVLRRVREAAVDTPAPASRVKKPNAKPGA